MIKAVYLNSYNFTLISVFTTLFKAIELEKAMLENALG